MIGYPPKDNDGNCMHCDKTTDKKKSDHCHCPMGLYDARGNVIDRKNADVWIMGNVEKTDKSETNDS